MLSLCLLPLRRASSLRNGRHGCHGVASSSVRYFTVDNQKGTSPLVLWLSGHADAVVSTSSTALNPPHRLLVPIIDQRHVVSSPHEVVEAVEQHYALGHDESSTQFVGGMGESDAGVWFCSQTHHDPLHYWKLMQESIATIKQSRHGIPFGAYTSGVDLPGDLPPLQEIGLDRIQVSLLAGNPTDYAAATKLNSVEAKKHFGEVCGYCITVSETGFPLEVAVLQAYASSARDLAVSLGAVDVHIYQDDK